MSRSLTLQPTRCAGRISSRANSSNEPVEPRAHRLASSWVSMSLSAIPHTYICHQCSLRPQGVNNAACDLQRTCGVRWSSGGPRGALKAGAIRAMSRPLAVRRCAPGRHAEERCDGQGLRDRQPEGRRRKDHDERQPRRVAGSRRSARVLLIDMDPQGNAGSGSGWHPRASARHLRRAPGPGAPRGRGRPTALPSLKLCPASPALVGAEIELIDMERRDLLLRDALERVRKRYDYILIDCRPRSGCSPSTRSARPTRCWCRCSASSTRWRASPSS
jgi:hypothetical protein